MASEGSDGTGGADGAGTGATGAHELPVAVKILVAGGFGAGKTTLVGSVSEIAPLSTEEVMTEASMGVDDTGGVEAKTTTTVALDFGRITVSERVVLYLFGTPGQGRFWFMWDELASGALGAVVVADTRRLESCFPAVDFFERRGVPFAVAVNQFDGAHRYTAQEVREAVDVDPHVPVVLGDARERESGKEVLLSLVEHVIRRRSPALSG
ncbi:ATP/GTP-binding protein [Nocardiopsis sp. RSe5-2]|uniref:ATP/GTP-binding protein n=1 Tax=Nocardiopsis endophytica TaxID=3018445 RepID=A0ABT4UDW5_9ACTN|nr:ATP/GTP-binding protein [Nocardiopsis endophytica]MDA2814654.1 ATP/GTP-binding protein [Nocardiopsis endophytica]